jgi:formylglycine-generating enzyme required for sulfatase activity
VAEDIPLERVTPRLTIEKHFIRHVQPSTRLALAFAALLLALAPSSAEEQKAREFKECSLCPVMVGIPAGRFAMGSPASEPGRFDAEGPQHYVSVKAFAIGKYDVTSEEFLRFLRDTGYQPEPCNPILKETWRSPGHGLAYPPYDTMPSRWPAVCLDWKDANAFIAWLNAKARSEHPSIGQRAGPYRLPSEAEWEYAARAGTTTARWWGDDLGNGNANCNGCGSQWDYRVLSDVDSFAPNPFGLYGMLGNAWQWTEDCWHPSYVGAPRDGRAWVVRGCARHVIRGGSWDNVPLFVRAAARSGAGSNGGEYDYSSLTGFRVARDLP